MHCKLACKSIQSRRRLARSVTEVSTTTSNGAPATGEGATPTKAPDESSTPLTKADLKVWSDAFASKVNGELAGLRKSLKGDKPAGGDAGDTTATKPEKQTSNAVTHEDLKAYRDLGRLETQLGDELVAQLGDEYAALPPAQQLAMLKMAMKVRDATSKRGDETASGADADGSRGETPVKTKQNSRAESPKPRDSVPRPANKREYIAMPKELRERVNNLPDFDASILPP